MFERLKKSNYIWNTLGTSLLSFLSLILMVVVTRTNSIEEAGIFTFSFSSATILNTLALYCGRTYQVTDSNSIISISTYFFSRLISALIAFIIAILFCLINSYPFQKGAIFSLLCLYKCIEAIIDYFYGIEQKNEVLYIAGYSMTARSLFMIFFFIVIDILSRNLFLSCLSLVLVSLFFLIFVDKRIANKYELLKYEIKVNEIKLFFRYAFYTCIFSLISMIVINIPKYAIDYLSTESVQAIYGIVSMPATFIMLFGQFVLQPSLVGMARAYQGNDKESFLRTVIFLSAVIFGSLIIIVPIAYTIGIPILSFIYGMDLNKYSIALIIIIIGAGFYTVSQVLLNALITLRCSKEQLVLQIVLCALSILISFTFVSLEGLRGSIVSYFAIMLLQFGFYCCLFTRIVQKKFRKD